MSGEQSDLSVATQCALRACADLMMLLLNSAAPEEVALIAEAGVRGCRLVVEVEPIGPPVTDRPRVEFILIDAEGTRHSMGRVAIGGMRVQ